jgi:hypothetical protein
MARRAKKPAEEPKIGVAGTRKIDREFEIEMWDGSIYRGTDNVGFRLIPNREPAPDAIVPMLAQAVRDRRDYELKNPPRKGRRA